MRSSTANRQETNPERRARRREVPLSNLTAREVEVLRFIAEGSVASEIASLLDISQKTVETHRRNLGGKLGLRRTALLTKYAIRQGVTSL